MHRSDPHEEVSKLKRQIERVMLETARAGKDVRPLVTDLKAILKNAEPS